MELIYWSVNLSSRRGREWGTYIYIYLFIYKILNKLELQIVTTAQTDTFPFTLIFKQPLFIGFCVFLANMN